MKIFEYKDNSNKYWDKAKLYKQVVNKALFIAKILYPNYLLLIFFNNTTNYSIYIKDILHIKNINKITSS